MKKRVLSFVLVLFLVVGCLPLSVGATENWLWPADGCYVISSNFGYRSDGKSTHNGIDIVCKSGGTSGKPVRASKSGTIYQGHSTMADNTYYATGTNSMGNYTMVNHGDGTYAVYMHMKPGNKVTGSVKRGDIIGYIGKTGASTGAHLHFEIYTNASNRKGSNLNPMPTNSEITLNNKYNLPPGWASQKTTYILSAYKDTMSTITLDAQGGSCSQSVIYRDWGDDWDLPTATRSGYKFEGWFSEKNGKGSNYSKEERFWGKSETKTVYAYWTLSSQDWGEGTPGSPTSVSIKTDKSTYTLGETVKVTPSSTGGKKYTIHFELNGTIMYHDWDGFTGSMTYKPTEPGTYKVIVSAINDYGYRDASTTFKVEEAKWGEGTAGSPTNVSVKTDKSTYTLGETVKVTPSSTGGKKYTIHFEQNGAIVYHDWDGFTGSMTYKPTKAGTYKVVVSAENDYGYRDATTTFVVEEVKTGKINVNGYLNGEKQSSIKGWATFDVTVK